ncbi:MAG: prepilin-type N-terminal cleavage/methylation domain-containing protein [Myxococcota bacterium]|nr:prepilin-type N-terminal cleavage/methylation domain-containing protein [Myxococcota bacterium]
MSKVCAKPRQNGMTLLETLVAMMILGGGLLTMASVQMESIRGAQRGRHLSAAANLANSQIEQLQRAPWTEIADTSWTTPVSATQIVQRNDLDQAYSVSWQVLTLTTDLTKTLDVRVNWTESSGRSRSITVSSIRHNHEAL